MCSEESVKTTLVEKTLLRDSYVRYFKAEAGSKVGEAVKAGKAAHDLSVKI